MKKQLMLIGLAAIISTGCSHSIHSQHISDIDPDLNKARAKKVVVQTEQQVIMGLVFDIDYVDQAYQQLQEKCPGRIGAVATQHSTSHGFLHWTNKIRMEGLCLR